MQSRQRVVRFVVIVLSNMGIVFVDWLIVKAHCGGLGSFAWLVCLVYEHFKLLVAEFVVNCFSFPSGTRHRSNNTVLPMCRIDSDAASHLVTKIASDARGHKVVPSQNGRVQSVSTFRVFGVQQNNVLL